MKNLVILGLASLVLVVIGAGCASPGGNGDDDGSVYSWENVLPDRSYPYDGDPVPASEFAAESVKFAYDSHRVATSEIDKVERVASFMKSKRDVHLVVEGHCDENGSREYNMSLGERRALAVREYLIELGVRGSRIQTRSYGEEVPVDPGHSEQSWRINRRGEFALYRPR